MNADEDMQDAGTRVQLMKSIPGYNKVVLSSSRKAVLQKLIDSWQLKMDPYTTARLEGVKLDFTGARGSLCVVHATFAPHLSSVRCVSSHAALCVGFV